MLEEISQKNVGEMAVVAPTDDDVKVGGVYEPAGNEDFQARFLKNLMAKREEVEQTITRLIESQRAYGNLFSGDGLIEDLDHADREISAQTFCKLIERKGRELDKIDLLIRRIMHDEEFGLCEECGERIPEERLFIVPEATLCVPCLREIEKIESRSGVARGSHPSSHWKKGQEWAEQEDADDDSGFFITTDDDYVSFQDMEELDVEERPAE
jgi:RNA polymerase-binding transcription factor DksA